ncbi:MAG TPA: hypothetical protein VLL07_01220 [Pontiella sp.]|nr:hypothetical protein [Pontiella sp.]
MKKNLVEAVCIVAVLLAGMPVFGQSLADETEREEMDNRMGMVLDMERSTENDILVLRNGDHLVGSILNDDFGIRTFYGQLNLKSELVAGIDLEGGENSIEAIITVNNNRFSGFIENPVFSVKLDAGPLVQVRRERVSKVVFHLRKGERDGLKQGRYLELKNGDYFSGTILNRMIVVAAAYGDVPVKLDAIKTISITGGSFPVVKIAQTNDTVVQGSLKTEDVEVMLDIGTMVKLFQDRIDKISAQQGDIPESAKIVGSSGQAVQVRSLDQLMARFIGSGPAASSGLGIGTVPDDSPFAGALEKGDVIESINGEPYGKGMLSASAKALMSGEVPVLTFGITRGDQSFNLRVTKE